MAARPYLAQDARHVCRAGGLAAMVMTQQYLAGELSLLLAQLRAVSTDPTFAGQLDALRGEAETRPVTALRAVVVRAIRLADVVCWDSVSRGDVASFDHQAAAAAELLEFGLCSGFLEENCGTHQEVQR